MFQLARALAITTRRVSLFAALALIALGGFFFLARPAPILAQVPDPASQYYGLTPGQGFGEVNIGQSQDLISVIALIINIALGFLGIVALGLIIYAGFLWMTARGNEDQVKKAQQIIITTVIGMVIVVAAYSITTFVVPKILNKTGGSGASEEVGGTKVECCKLCKTGMSGWFKTECPQKPMTEKECLSLEYKYIGLKPASECK